AEVDGNVDTNADNTVDNTVDAPATQGGEVVKVNLTTSQVEGSTVATPMVAPVTSAPKVATSSESTKVAVEYGTTAKELPNTGESENIMLY
ncbi:hypothetical protein, partial [Streptococcus suis]|uniref:hypothetical protein n=1 Tax=Streptococcus suis TaxID=1307 RepID=UPI00137A6B80